MIKRGGLSGLIIACILVSLVAAGCGQGGSTGSQSPSATVPSTSTELADVISAEAVVVPYREAALGFSTAGRVQEMLVTEGDTVAAGQELARLDTHDLQLAVRQAEAALALAQAQLAKVKAGALPEQVAVAEADVSVAAANVSSATASLDGAKASLQKAAAGPTQRDIQIAQKQVELAKNQLWAAQGQRDAVGGVDTGSGADYEAAQGQVATAETQVAIAELQLQKLLAGAVEEDLAVLRAQVKQAESAVLIAKAQLEKARAQLGLVKAGARAEDIAVAEAPVVEAQVGLDAAKSTLADAVLTAPFSGTVGAILVQEGEVAAPQVPVITLGDVSILRVRTLDLGEADVSQVQVGQAATVTVDALGGKKLPAKVASIAPLATERRGDTVYAVTLDLEVGTDSGLRWGMNAYVEITVR